MAAINSFRELEVYAEATNGARSVFFLTRRFPAEERYSLTDQIRRSSRAVAAMIAEAWAHRRYKASFISILTDAIGETMETQSWLDHAMEVKYITAETHKNLDDLYQQLGGKLSRMILKADRFCPSQMARSMAKPRSSILNPPSS